MTPWKRRTTWSSVFSARMISLKTFNNFNRTIITTIINNQKFDTVKCLTEGRLHCFLNVVNSFIDWYSYGNFIIHFIKSQIYFSTVLLSDQF